MGLSPCPSSFSQSAFQSGQGAEAVSVTEAKRRLRELLMGEDQRRPYSDQRLSELMGEQGCPISRRTVAKYRSELGFPGHRGEKEELRRMSIYKIPDVIRVHNRVLNHIAPFPVEGGGESAPGV